MPQLDDNLLRKQFVGKLLFCERARGLTEWQAQFIKGMRQHLENREIAAQLGGPTWNPSVKQLNSLNQIAMAHGYGRIPM